MTAPLTLTRQDVRRLAMSQQHLADADPVPILDVIRDIGCLQLDPIRAVERTHLLVLWSRLDAFDRTELKRLRWREKALFEYWAHAASLVLTEEYPVHNWFMRHKQNNNQRVQEWFTETPGLAELRDHILQRLEQDGPLFSREFESQAKMEWTGGWTSGRFVNRLLDILWSRGKVMVVGRKGNQRQWGLAEHFLPEWTPRDAWTAEQACRFAAQKAVRALGAATARQIKVHYTRQRYPELTKVLDKLVAEGVLLETAVTDADTNDTWYLHAEDLPRLQAIQVGDWQPRTTLLSPFDNLICDRDRTELLWDFFFRIEIYVPKAKREYGYYVLPILHGDRLIGRMDPKMDRKTRTLYINAVYAEADAPDDRETVTAVREAVQSLAGFLEAEKIDWGDVPAQWANLPG